MSVRSVTCKEAFGARFCRVSRIFQRGDMARRDDSILYSMEFISKKRV